MIRRKKLLKLGKVHKEPKSREQLAYEKLVAEAVANNAKRAKDKKYKEQKRAESKADYERTFSNKPIEPNKGWHDTIVLKKNIFTPTRLDNLDLDEINAKRLANNITTPIEQAEQQAQDEIARKATQVAVVCHKSGYQYVGTGKDAKDFGKKTSQME